MKSNYIFPAQIHANKRRKCVLCGGGKEVRVVCEDVLFKVHEKLYDRKSDTKDNVARLHKQKQKKNNNSPNYIE